MEYMIQENTLIEMANVLRGKMEYKDLVYGLISDKKRLVDAVVPDGVTSISYYAFYGCTSLTDLYLHPTTPPTLRNTSAISTATTTIHVPVGSGDAYKSATNWSSFADIIVEDIVVE